ncbi:MAG: SpoIIE family protein phosphatase [Isosphaeraceae bacterium]
MASRPPGGGAQRLAVAPVETRNGTRGVLVLWSDEAGRAFDMRVIRQAHALASQAVLAIEADRLNRAAVDHGLIRKELEIGSRVQQTLLLANPKQPSKFARVATLAVPSQQVGGDFVEAFPQGPDCLAVLIGDVMGKGLKAALVGAAVSRQFHRTLCALMSGHPTHAPEPSMVVSAVHRDVIRHLLEIESFVTLNYARIDHRRRRLEFVDCGHTPVLHYRRGSGRVEWLGGESMPMGFRRLQEYEQVSVPFGAGDLFVFYSDGLIDARNADGEPFGPDRLADLVGRFAGRVESGGFPALVLDEVTAFAGPLGDDLACIFVEIVAESPASPPVLSMELGSDLAQLQDLRSFVRAVCGEFADPPPDESSVSGLELAITELASNVMIHAYGREPDRWMRVEAEIWPDQLRFRLLHAGRGYDPAVEEAPVPVLDGTAEGGFGLFLIGRCVDDVTYALNQCGLHEITLTKGRAGSAARSNRGDS